MNIEIVRSVLELLVVLILCYNDWKLGKENEKNLKIIYEFESKCNELVGAINKQESKLKELKDFNDPNNEVYKLWKGIDLLDKKKVNKH